MEYIVQYSGIDNVSFARKSQVEQFISREKKEWKAFLEHFNTVREFQSIPMSRGVATTRVRTH